MIDLDQAVDHSSVLGYYGSFSQVGKLVNLVVMNIFQKVKYFKYSEQFIIQINFVAIIRDYSLVNYVCTFTVNKIRSLLRTFKRRHSKQHILTLKIHPMCSYMLEERKAKVQRHFPFHQHNIY